MNHFKVKSGFELVLFRQLCRDQVVGSRRPLDLRNVEIFHFDFFQIFQFGRDDVTTTLKTNSKKQQKFLNIKIFLSVYPKQELARPLSKLEYNVDLGSVRLSELRCAEKKKKLKFFAKKVSNANLPKKKLFLTF